MQLKKYFLFILLPLFAFTVVHKFYVSVTNINYSEKDDALQITTRIFIDDLEGLLKERYGLTAQLAGPNEDKTSDFYIEKYLRTKLSVLLDGKAQPLKFLGKRYENDVVLCYMEIEAIGFNSRKKLSIQNEVLTDLFPDQKNIVHIKWKGNKKSFVLIKENSKGTVKIE